MPRHKRNRAAKREAPAAAVLPTKRPRWVVPIALAAICAATFWAYSPAQRGSMVWDDDDNLTRPELQSAAGLYRIWFDPSSTGQYYPLHHTVFWLEHKLWGDNYAGYHRTNVVWHCLSVVLFYSVLRRLKIPGAILAAAIFALHPVMVESVAWMTEQKNTLSMAFYLSAAIVYLHFDETRQRRSYYASLLLFTLALMIKTVVVTLPAALLVIFWWQRGAVNFRRDVLPLAPFFLLGIASGVVTYLVEHSYVRDEVVQYDLTIVERFLLAGRNIWFYLSKLAWPNNLTFVYPRWTIDPHHWSQWLYPIAAVATTIALWLLRKCSRGPFAAWLFYCGTLLPVLGFVNVYMFRYSFVADHLQYLASPGIIAIFSAGATIYLLREPRQLREVGVVLCVVYVATLAAFSYRQSKMYVDAATLYQETLRRNPDCWMAHNNLGVQLASAGNHTVAIDYYRAALRLNPGYLEAHNNLGKALVNTGKPDEAIAEFQAALKINPKFPQALYNLGITLQNARRNIEAIEAFRSFLETSRDQADMVNRRSLVQQAVSIARANGNLAAADQIEQLMRSHEQQTQVNVPSEPTTAH